MAAPVEVVEAEDAGLVAAKAEPEESARVADVAAEEEPEARAESAAWVVVGPEARAAAEEEPTEERWANGSRCRARPSPNFHWAWDA